jgi:hypothetical protein
VRGLDREDAKKQLSALVEKPERREIYEKLISKLTATMEFLESVRGTGANTYGQIQASLGGMAAAMVGSALANKKDPVNEGVEDALKHVVKMKIIDRVFGSGEDLALKSIVGKIEEIEARIRKLEAEE